MKNILPEAKNLNYKHEKLSLNVKLHEILYQPVRIKSLSPATDTVCSAHNMDTALAV